MLIPKLQAQSHHSGSCGMERPGELKDRVTSYSPERDYLPHTHVPAYVVARTDPHLGCHGEQGQASPLPTTLKFLANKTTGPKAPTRHLMVAGLSMSVLARMRHMQTS